MDTHATAAMILQSIETGTTTPEVIERQMAQMEEALDRGAQVLGLKGTPDEAREVIALVRAGLAPQPAASAMVATVEPIDAQAAVTLHPTTDDALQHAVLDTETMTLTTAHAASSYGQPVVLRQDGTLVDYAAIEAVHLLGSTADQAATVARALEPFGLRVTWQARSADPTEA